MLSQTELGLVSDTKMMIRETDYRNLSFGYMLENMVYRIFNEYYIIVNFYTLPYLVVFI